eukprot:TRINITY_DN6366_c0_g1_i1.p1 TRINITY_DN6366_c0_g1~~TRINITY_DN6366_c0_g1_i1.p1  ORF type:complete len:175 (-),score=22.27 TRINITY_DN6366_c0_g1_i1:198-722(-)
MFSLPVFVLLRGFRSLYRGLTPSLMGIVPYAGIDLTVYEYLRTQYANFLKNREKEKDTASTSTSSFSSSSLHAIAPLICGTLSSSVAQLVSYPLNLVRTRLQAQGVQSKAATSTATPVATAEVYTGMIDVFKKTIQKEGVRGLYRGILPNYMKVIPAVSISYTVYEYVKKTVSL